MKSFGLLRTNVGLTTNVKIMVDSNHNLSLNSIDSSDKLSSERFKKFNFTKSNYYDELVPFFFKEVPADNAFEVKFTSDNETMSDDFSLQYDEIYSYGARNIQNNKNYKEEFEYFAPIYINRKNLPKKFIVFRVDGPGLGLLSRDNFKTEILDKLKVVKIFDLTNGSNLGQWLETNYKDNKYFPEAPIEMDFRELEFCKWNGIDYKTGGYTTKSLFIDDILDEEKEIFEMEKFIFENFRKTETIFPNILNFSFLFDDEPSTPDFKRKWSLNRYFGFYLEDMELAKTISPYITPFLRPDVQISTGNILSSNSSPENPFIIEWTDSRPFYIEYNGNYYKVERYQEEGKVVLSQDRINPASRNQTKPLTNQEVENAIRTNRGQSQTTDPNQNRFTDEKYKTQIITRFRIISDVDLSGKINEINKNYGIIDSSNNLKDYNFEDIQIENFDNYSCWLIEIDGIFHNLIKKDNKIFVNADYSFQFNENDYIYKVSGIEKKVSTIVDSNNAPKKFNIYKLRFSDIKDFDDRILETDFSKFEYEKFDDITYTDETKFYLEDLNFSTNPRPIDDFVYKSKVVNIPTSSEYTANWETFKIENNDLSEIWRLNPVYCRWTYQGSIHTHDSPYLLNNSIIMEDFNRGPNPFIKDPSRIERNLDYFYTINSVTYSYSFHSLHIQNYLEDGMIDTNFKFDLSKYLNQGTYSEDYFSSIFEKKTSFNDNKILTNTKKFSMFNIGDNVISNTTLFRGLEFRISNVESITLNSSNEIDNINQFDRNEFENYKFSILLSKNQTTVSDSGQVTPINNLMEWLIIEEWQMDKEYPPASFVVYDDIIYYTNSTSNTETPAINLSTNSSLRRIKTSPYNLQQWSYYDNLYSIFWSPIRTYNTTNDNLVYNNGEYYYYTGSGADFWNPKTATENGYDLNDVVIYKGELYISSTSSNNLPPDSIDTWSSRKVVYKYWTKTESRRRKWQEVELWNQNKQYANNTYVYHEDTVWVSTSIVFAEEEPSVSNKWSRKHSFVPDTNFIYSPTTNIQIKMNNRYYLIASNESESTLDNGIIVYINKKWKNILININISDSTYGEEVFNERDRIYTDLYKKISLNNFSNCINDITNKYGFSDYLNYVVINEDGSIKKYRYDSNITQLPYLISCEFPDAFKVKINSLDKRPVKIPEKLLPYRSLKDGLIKNLEELNFYNTNLPVACHIIENKFEPKLMENIHGIKNKFTDEIYRFSGYYMPVFYDIELFEKGNESMPTGNYKFDTSLTSFGMMKERKIRKCNTKGSILKLRNQPDQQSIYVMLDEFGYTTLDFFIFKSTWDYEYHLQTIQNPLNRNIVPDIPRANVETIVSESIGRSKADEEEKNTNL